jgi:predicted nucleic acid-binding protein
MKVLIDASALLPILIHEPEKEYIVNATRNCELLAPFMLPYEIGNALSRLKKRQILDEKQIIAASNDFQKIPLRLLEVDIENALKIASKYTIYAYDAYYLETACRLKIPLLTLDEPMKKIAFGLKLKILEE